MSQDLYSSAPSLVTNADGTADTTFEMEVARMMCGRELGSGCSRSVHALLLLPDLVVKWEAVGTCNFVEYETWSIAREHPDLAKWLAPVELITNNGRLLCMHRTQRIENVRDLPEKVPAFLNHDLKTTNWGLLDGRPVCHDYGNSVLAKYGVNSEKLVKAKWWVAET